MDGFIGLQKLAQRCKIDSETLLLSKKVKVKAFLSIDIAKAWIDQYENRI